MPTPTPSYTPEQRQEFQAEILRSMHCGQSLNEAVRSLPHPGPCRRTIYNWAYEDEEFRKALQKARDALYGTWQDEYDDLCAELLKSRDREKIRALESVLHALQWKMERRQKQLYGQDPKALIQIDNSDRRTIALSQEDREAWREQRARLLAGANGERK